MEDKLPPAPMGRRAYGPIERLSISMPKPEKERLLDLAKKKHTTASETVRLSLDNQHYLESVVNDGGQIIVETGDGQRYDFSPF